MESHSYDLGIGLSDDHRALAESVRTFTERYFNSEALHAAVGTAEKPELPAFWTALAEQGLLGLHIPEELGGAGAGLLELAVALEAFGRAAAGGPFLSTVATSAVLTAAGVTDRVADLAEGTVIGAVSIGTPLTATASGSGYTLSGSTHALTGHLAQLFVLPVAVDGATRYAVLDAAGLVISPVDAIDQIRGAATVSADNLAIDAAALLDIDASFVEALVGLLVSAEAVGVASWATGTAADYAKVREQFGRPIGQFQGVKHKCATMGIELEKARAVVWDAVIAFDEKDSAAVTAATIANAVAVDVAVANIQDCIQVLGGIGFTWEHSAHLYYRRALTLRSLLGTHSDRLAAVGAAALRGEERGIELSLPPEADELRATIAAEVDVIKNLTGDDQLRALAEGGYVLTHLDKPWGRSAGPLEQIVAAQELKRADVHLPQLAMGSWAVQAIAAYGTDEQQRRWIPDTLSGETVWCQLFSEPGAGSDLAALTTKAEKVDGGWKVNGQKIWTSVAQFSELAMLIARTDPSAPKHEGITYFIIDMDSPGVTVKPLREMTGGALFNQVFLDDVFVPEERLLGEVNKGWDVARKTLAGERVALGSGDLPLYGSLPKLLKLLDGREVKDLAGLGYVVSQNQARYLIGTRIILQQLSGTDASTTSSIGKFLSTKFSQQVAEFALEELGTEASFQLSSGGRNWTDYLLGSRATTIYGGTTEIQLNVIAERMLGLPRDA